MQCRRISNYVVLLLIVTFFSGCAEKVKVKLTPSDYLNTVNVTHEEYSRDSIAILNALNRKLAENQSPYESKKIYTDSTVLIIDSIMYDSSKDKIGIFVIAQNPVFLINQMDFVDSLYYNANCFLGKRIISRSDSFDLKVMGPFQLVNFKSITIVKEAIRGSYFIELTNWFDEKSLPYYDYNLNDKRFWTSLKGWPRAFPQHNVKL